MQVRNDDEEKVRIREYVATLPGKLADSAEDFLMMQLTYDQVRTFVETARRCNEKWWTEAVDEEDVKRMKKAVGNAANFRYGEGGRFVHSVKEKLTADEVAWLKEEFANSVDLNFHQERDAVRGDHPLLSAMRKISRSLLKRAKGAEGNVFEVGAKVTHVVMDGVEPGKYLASVPILNMHDEQRHSVTTEVQLMLRRKGSNRLRPEQKVVAETYLKDFDSMFTRKRLQDVTWPADTVLSVDANYDIALIDCVRFMIRNGTREWLGCMVRCEQADVYFGKQEGRLECGFDYQLDAEKDKIAFKFRSSAFPYEHSLSIYREYMNSFGKVWRADGCYFTYVELPSSTSSYLHFAIVRVDGVPRMETGPAYVATGMEGMLRVDHPSVVLDKGKKTISASHFFVAEETFARIVRERVTASSDAPEEVVRAIRAARLRVVVNGVSVSTEDRVVYSLVKTLAAVVRVLVRDVRRSTDSDAKRAWRVIADGGVATKGVIGAIVDRVNRAVTEATTSLTRAIGAYGSVEHAIVGVSVRRAEMFEKRERPGIVWVGEDPILDVRRCRCEALRRVTIALEAENNVFSVSERSTMQVYKTLLERHRCVDCSIQPLSEFDLDDGYTSEDEFFDAETGTTSSSEETLARTDSSVATSSDGDSGFSSQTSECEEIVDGENARPAREATREYAEILRLQMDAAFSEGKQWAGLLWPSRDDSGFLEAQSTTRLTHVFLRVNYGFVDSHVGTAADSNAYAWAYDVVAQKWWKATRAPGGQCVFPETAGAVLYTNSAFLIWNQPSLLAAAKKVLSDSGYGASVGLESVRGIYGCGKTTEIASLFGSNDGYMAQSKEGVLDFRRRVYGTEERKDNVCTYDSAMMHGFREGVETLYMDEMPMAHSGQLLALIWLVKPKRVVAYGDDKQVTFIPFVAGFNALHATSGWHGKRSVRNVTHRCRLSVCAATLRYYGEDSGITSCMCCANVLESEEGLLLRPFTAKAQLPLVKGVKFLTVTWADNEIMEGILRENPLGNEDPDYNVAHNIGSVQGKAFDRVALVRFNNGTKPGTRYFDGRQVVTGVSRSRTVTEYWTMSLERDGFVQACMDAKDERLLAIVRQSREATAGEKPSSF